MDHLDRSGCLAAMFNLIIILVLSLTSCEAIVRRLTKAKAPGLTEDMLEATNTMLVYCSEEHSLVFRCFQLNGPKEYYHADYPKSLFIAQASGYISKGPCTYDGEEMSSGEFRTYVTMEACADIKNVNINEDGTILEAKLLGRWWETIDKGVSKFRQSDTPTLTKPVSEWNLLNHPRQGKPKSGPIWYCNKMYSCGSCTMKRLCAPLRGSKESRFYQVNSEQCSEKAPYCNYASGGCTEEADPECLNYPEKDVDDDFICMRDGYFPDPKSCNKFYTCRERVAYVHYCPAKFTPYYHPGLKYCIASDEFCTPKTSTVSCDDNKNKGKKVSVKYTDEKLYLTCTSDYLLLDRCIGAYKFDPEKQECVFKCPHEGLFLSSEHCKKYIKCTPLPIGGFKEERLECEDNQGFSEKDFACVDEAKVPNCQESSPDFYNK